MHVGQVHDSEVQHWSNRQSHLRTPSPATHPIPSMYLRMQRRFLLFCGEETKAALLSRGHQMRRLLRSASDTQPTYSLSTCTNPDKRARLTPTMGVKCTHFHFRRGKSGRSKPGRGVIFWRLRRRLLFHICDPFFVAPVWEVVQWVSSTTVSRSGLAQQNADRGQAERGEGR
jgi:hypothetical protein